MIDYDGSVLLFALSCAIDIAIVCGALAWMRGGSFAARLAVSALLASAALALKGIALVAGGLGIFGVAHVLWLDVAVVAPVAALFVAAITRRRLRWTALTMGTALAGIGIYASLVEPSRLTTERATVSLPQARAGRAPVRIGVLADLQFQRVGGHERRAVRRLVAERPDVILLAGDYHQGTAQQFAQELPRIRALLARLRAPGGVYAVPGDVDGGDAEAVVAGTGVRLLVNRVVRARVRDRRLTIAGIELAYDSPAARAVASRLQGGHDPRDVRILLAHRPDAVLGLAVDTRVDLTVAGHTHGGQVQLPPIGPIATISDIPRRVAAGGLHTLNGRRIYVSRGVGVERAQAPRLRFRAVPEISILTLR